MQQHCCQRGGKESGGASTVSRPAAHKVTRVRDRLALLLASRDPRESTGSPQPVLARAHLQRGRAGPAACVRPSRTSSCEEGEGVNQSHT
jgi:hypothetical protein